MFDSAVLFSDYKDVKHILHSITDESEWCNWIESSDKADLPPDFYNDNKGLMMEVMRFDDKAKMDGSFHATKKKESKLLNDIRENDFEIDFPI